MRTKSGRTCIVETLLPDYEELAKVLTPSQIAEKIGANADTVRRFLKREGIDMLRWCKKCRENRHESEFDGPARRSCNRHESVRRPNKRTEREWDDDMWQSVREDRALFDMCWMATEQGQPNGPVRAVEV